jgi:predicted DNA-binding protein with PD1-like motif
MMVQGKTGRILVGRLAHGSDLLEELTRVAAENVVLAGRVEVIGAVSRARFGYYDQTKREYVYFEREEPLEILALVGNVSLKDRGCFVHAHVTLADEEGRAFGGHLAEGTTVFAAEFRIEELAGVELHRVPDKTTGLALWG